MTNLNTVTPLQLTMLAEINSYMDAENISSYDGLDLEPVQKGVLGSLVAQNYVFDTYEGEDEPGYCLTVKGEKVLLNTGVSLTYDIYGREYGQE